MKDYIGECVESLLAQTYKNLEILLVDDGSTDGSGVMCDEYAVQDSRVRVIHQDNQGPSAARNQGLDDARGEYVAFVDSDDAVVPDFIETLLGILNKYQADIAACAYIKCGADDLMRNRKRELHIDNNENKEICMTSKQMLRQWHGRYKKWETVAWNKLYMYRTTPNSRAFQSRMAELMEENLCAQRERMAFFKERRYWRAYFKLLVGYVLHSAWFEWKRVKQSIWRKKLKPYL